MISRLSRSFKKRVANFVLSRFLNDSEIQRFIIRNLRRLPPDQRALIKNDNAGFLLEVCDFLEESPAQLMQDIWVLHELDRKRDGFFVEFGATDGKSLSNTYLLEKKFGWKGILAEPNPLWHEALKRNRTAAISTKCVYSRSGEEVSFMASSYPELGGVVDFLRPDEREKYAQTSEVIRVPTISLNDLLAEHKAPQNIDFMSIDTEGSELDILENFDFDAWNVQLFCIEHNDTPTKARLFELMAEKGYETKFENLSDFDGWFSRRK